MLATAKYGYLMYTTSNVLIVHFYFLQIIVLLVKINATLLEMQDHPYLKQIIHEIIYNGPWNE